MKKRVALTFSGLILAIAGLMLSVLFLPSNTTITALASDKPYAESAGIAPLSAQSNGTFLDFRSGLSGHNSHLDFMSKAFQHNRYNFVYRGGYEIANLRGYRHSTTLRGQSTAITNRRYISSTAGLTIFASGQGGNYTQWTHDNHFDPNSLLERLRRQSGGNVYQARANFTFFTDNPLSVSFAHDRARFTLRRLEIASCGTRYAPRVVDNITDFTRHNIILWDTACGTTRYHDYLYNQLNAVLTQILYDYLLHNGSVPLLNMVSHSTGGVLNMMWANKHPHNVHSLFSFGGPFNGTPMGSALYLDRDHPSIAEFGDMMGPALDAIRSLSGFENMNPARHDALRVGWANAVNTNPNIRLHAIYAQQQMHM